MATALAWPGISRRALRVWQRNRDVYLNTWRAELVWPLLEPALTLVALGLGLGEFVELGRPERYIDFVAPGLLAIFPMWAASSEAGWGAYFRMESQRTFDAILATPLDVDDITTGEVLWAATRSIISVAYILVVAAAFGAVASPLAVLALPFGLLPGLLFGAASLCYTAVARSVSSLNYFFALFITPQFWLSGAFFPLDQMPAWVRAVAWWSPAAHATDIYRGLLRGGLEASHLYDLLWLLVATALFHLLATNLLRRRLVR